MPTGTRPPPAILGLAALAIALLALPLVGLLARAPWGRGLEILASEASLGALRLSLVVSGLATLAALLLGFPLAWLLARASFPGRGLVRALVLLPLVLPPVVGGVGLLAAWGRRGLLGAWLDPLGLALPFTPGAAVLAATFVSLPLVVLAVESGLQSLDPRLEQAALTLGASPGYALRRVTLPLLRPQLLAGLILAWVRALGEFGATITFAGNLRGRTQTLPLAVYETLQTDPEAAVLMSLGLVAISALGLWLVRGRTPGRPG